MVIIEKFIPELEKIALNVGKPKMCQTGPGKWHFGSRKGPGKILECCDGNCVGTMSIVL